MSIPYFEDPLLNFAAAQIADEIGDGRIPNAPAEGYNATTEALSASMDRVIEAFIRDGGRVPDRRSLKVALGTSCLQLLLTPGRS